jgi:hypothetical protein
MTNRTTPPPSVDERRTGVKRVKPGHPRSTVEHMRGTLACLAWPDGPSASTSEMRSIDLASNSCHASAPRSDGILRPLGRGEVEAKSLVHTLPRCRQSDPLGLAAPEELGDLAAGLDEAGFVGEYDGLCAVVEVEFGEDAGDVGFDGCVADGEGVGDVGV